MKIYKASRYNIYSAIKNNSKSWIYANTFSGCIMRTDQELKKFLENFNMDSFNKLEKEHPDIANYLIEKGFIVQEMLDEITRVRLRFQTSKFLSDCLNLTLLPTSDCNLGCPYCYQERNPISFSDNVVAQLKQFVSNHIPNIKHLSVTWYGGEPLLKQNLISDISQYFIKICNQSEVTYSSNMVTNGTLLNEQSVDLLKKSQVKRLQVTLDGSEKIHNARRFFRTSKKNSFRMIINGLKACEGMIPVNIRINIDKSNSANYPDIVQLLVNEGLIGKNNDNSVSLGLVKPLTDEVQDHKAKLLSFQEFGELLVEFKKHLYSKGINKDLSFDFNPSTPCGAVNINSYLISSEGRLKKCWAHSTSPETEFGDLSKGVDPSNPTTINWHGYDPTLDEECSKCNILPICTGGCPVEMMSIPNFKKKYCSYKREYINDNLLLAGIVKTNKNQREELK